MARQCSQAEYYRAHRRAFRLALETGCTPAEAAERLRHREAAARHRAAVERLEAKLAAPIRARIDAPPSDAPWMMRD
jgi:hypothetical protein